MRNTKTAVPKIRLGSGQYGSVYKITHGKSELAIKGNYVEGRSNFVASLRELNIAIQMRDHPYIVRIESVCFPQAHQAVNSIISPPRVKDDRRDDIVMNFECVETNLQTVLNDDKTALEQHGRRLLQQSQILELIFQILMAMEYFHSKNLIHRDIKPDNFLLKRNPLTIKLCDFGMSRPETTQGDMTPRLVAPVYRSPELAAGAVHYTQAVDCWSVGLILAQLLLGFPLFWIDANDDVNLLRIIYLKHPTALPLPAFTQIATFPNGCLTEQQISQIYTNRARMGWSDLLRGVDPGLRDIIVGLLDMDPQRRWTMSQALNAPYWVNWQGRRQEIYAQFPLQIAERRYQIENTNYLYALLRSTRIIVQNYRYEVWFGWHRIFLLLNLIFTYVSNIAGDSNALLPEVDLHCYILLYMVIKYYAAVRKGFSWSEVAPQYASAPMMERARLCEQQILVVISYMTYTPTVYDVAPRKLTDYDCVRLFEYMTLTPQALNGRFPSEIVRCL